MPAQEKKKNLFRMHFCGDTGGIMCRWGGLFVDIQRWCAAAFLWGHQIGRGCHRRGSANTIDGLHCEKQGEEPFF